MDRQPEMLHAQLQQARFRQRMDQRLPWTAWLLVIVGMLALGSLALEFGFDTPLLPVGVLTAVQLAAIALYPVHVAASIWRAETWRAGLKSRGFDLLVIGAGVVLLFSPFGLAPLPVSWLKSGTVYVGTLQILIVLRAAIALLRWQLELSHQGWRPARMLVLGFVMLIVVGGLLLSLPRALAPETRALVAARPAAHVLDAFFTATSAACVTGLIVYDTGSDFSRFGQIVVIVLIQLGGLGIMIAASVLALLLGRQLSVRQSLLLQDALSHETIGHMGRTVRFVVLMTLGIEFVGAAVCFMLFRDIEPLSERIFYSVFHAVSAFCNAGFAMRGDSLAAYQGHWYLHASIVPLIILGGLGFPVLADFWSSVRSMARRPAASAALTVQGQARLQRPRVVARFRLHTRLVLVTTLVLIVVPAVLFFIFETAGQDARQSVGDVSAPVIAELPPMRRAAACVFLSVTTRTAGFNSTSVDDCFLSPATQFLVMILMFIGGSPASTAGGVKTVALAVLVLGVISVLRRRPHVEVFNRSIPRALIERASVLVFMMIVLISAVTLALCVTEDAPLRMVLFEAVSACNTVGLSTGLTAQLSPVGECIIMLGMFAGRLGPLTLIVALASDCPPARYEYPTEQLTIG